VGPSSGGGAALPGRGMCPGRAARWIRLGDSLQPWPVDGSGRDHSRLVRESSSTEVMKYLHDLDEGWVAVTNPKMRVGVGFVFDPAVFDCVWLWHEFGYTLEYPWFGRAYVLGVEPMSSLRGRARQAGDCSVSRVSRAWKPTSSPSSTREEESKASRGPAQSRPGPLNPEF